MQTIVIIISIHLPKKSMKSAVNNSILISVLYLLWECYFFTYPKVKFEYLNIRGGLWFALLIKPQ
jgi:hypothetical protein